MVLCCWQSAPHYGDPDTDLCYCSTSVGLILALLEGEMEGSAEVEGSGEVEGSWGDGGVRGGGGIRTQ